MEEIGHSESASDVDVQVLLDALGGKYSGELLCAAETPQSASALSEEIDAPIATCYRRIEDLVDAGLLTCAGSEASGTGKRSYVYRRTVDEVSVDLSGDSPELTIQHRSSPTADSRRHRFVRD